jgi:hypothetical protein
MTDIKKYIEQEKNISRFKLEVLDKVDRPYKKRAVSKEKRFIDFDFESCNFKSIDEARYALDLFRSSEEDFYIKYNFQYEELSNFNLEKVSKFIKEKKGDVICNKYVYLDYLNKKTTNSDGSIKKVICDRNLLLSDFLSFLLKNISLLKSNIDYLKLKSIVIKCMFDKGRISNCKDILEESKDNLYILNKTKKTKLLVTQITHSSNEKMYPVSCKIVTTGNSIWLDKFKNIKNNGKYLKSLKINDENVDVMEDIELDRSHCIVLNTRRASESFAQIEKNIKIIIKELSEAFNLKINF